MKKKTCRVCGKLKPEGAYYKTGNGKRYTDCKKCYNWFRSNKYLKKCKADPEYAALSPLEKINKKDLDIAKSTNVYLYAMNEKENIKKAKELHHCYEYQRNKRIAADRRRRRKRVHETIQEYTRDACSVSMKNLFNTGIRKD